MARQVKLHIISKLRHDSALYIPYQHPDPNHRSQRKYGEKLDWRNISDEYLCQSSIESDIQTDIYQATLSVLCDDKYTQLEISSLSLLNLHESEIDNYVEFQCDNLIKCYE